MFEVAAGKGRRAVKHLLTAFLMFWVMWHQDFSNTAIKYIWTAGDFFESKDQCRTAVVQIIELKEKEKTTTKDGSPFMKFQVPEDGLLGYFDKTTDKTQTFTCLPEGRKPKDD